MPLLSETNSYKVRFSLVNLRLENDAESFGCARAWILNTCVCYHELHWNTIVDDDTEAADMLESATNDNRRSSPRVQLNNQWLVGKREDCVRS